MTESVYFFNDYQQLIKIVGEEKIIESIQVKEITTSKDDLLNSTLSVAIKYDDELTDAAFMAVKEIDNYYSLFRIIKVSDPVNQLVFTGIDFAPDELDGYIVKDIRPKNESVSRVANRIIAETEWRIGHVDNGLKNVNGSFYYISVKESLKQLQTFGCEVLFKCNLNGDGISDKWIEIYQQIGIESDKRYTYGDKALTVVKEMDRSQVYTSIIGRGRGEEVGDGYGRRLEFTNVEWKKSTGNPLDKPKGQNWLEMPEMTKVYGIPTKDGKMRKREKVAVFDDEEDASVLLNKTYDELVECSRPLVQFKATVSSGDDIGNIVTIHRYDRGYHYKTRIFKTTTNRLNNTVEASIGDNLSSSMSRKTSQLTNGIQSLEETKQTFYDSTEISKWQTDIIRGAKGGSILLMNPEDTGKGTSREPYQMVWMDGPSLDKSNHFLVANSEGIGFIEGDFNLDNFKTAWTIDGVFNADFIKAGILDGIEVHSRNKNYDIELNNGKLAFRGGDKQKELGSIQATAYSTEGKPIPGMYFTTKDPYITKFMVDNLDGSTDEAISILPKNFGGVAQPKGSGVYIDVHTAIRKGLEVQEGLMVFGDLKIQGKLIVNGNEITGNGSGGGGGNTGGWNGQYPPEVTTSAEKFAWQAWVTLLSLGYSKAAAAGILGNINGEAGPSMNPDTEQVGGPAYGAVQFDGSSYPLIGSPTNDGREYFQRLHKASGAGGDYREMGPQMKVVDWGMTNGQWIGKVAPASVGGFKGMTSPEQAAYVFEENYERPANAHPERQGYARTWYDKFVNLNIPSSDWLTPVRVGYVVTQEWDQIGWGTSVIHGGIDLAPTGGGNPPIYAAKAGTIMAVGNNPGLEGNYVMIDHNDGYYTYYGHMVDGSVKVSDGEKVTNTTIIGLMGATGLASGVHLHFEVRKGGSSANFRINPRDVIKF